MEYIFSYLPFLMFFGFAWRLWKHFIDEAYPFSYRTPEGRMNISKSLWSLTIVIIFFVLALTIKADDSFDTTTTKGILLLIGWAINYIVWGWAIDSIFLYAMDRFSKKQLKAIDTMTGGKDDNK